MEQTIETGKGAGFRAKVDRGREPAGGGAETGWEQRHQSKPPLANSDPKSPDSKVKGLPLQLIDFAACCAMSHLGLFQKPMGQRQGPIQN